MSKFNVGDVVCRKNSVGDDWKLRVVFSTAINGVNYCGVVPETRTDIKGNSRDQFAIVMKDAAVGRSILGVDLAPEDTFQIYREPVVVAMTGDQYDRFLGAHGFPDPDDNGGYKTADLRGHDDL